MSTTRRLPPDWPEVLGQVEKWLTEAIEATHQRERALAALPASAAAPGADSALLRESAARLTSGPERASQNIAPLDADLQEYEESLRQWVSRAKVTRRRLAEWGERAIG
jgi:hypothetical protein